MPEPELLSASQVGGILGVTAESVRSWAKAGRIPFITLPSGQIRIRRSDVDAILAGATPAEAAS